MMLPEGRDWAVVRLVAQRARDRKSRLVFATVTLLSHGRPLPAAMKGVDRYRIRGTDTNLYFRYTVLLKDEAIGWYRSLGGGEGRTPVPSREGDKDPGLDGIDLLVSTLTDSPTWPHLGLPMGDGFFAHPSGRSHPAPFIGGRPARVHRRFGNNEGFDALIADEAAIAFVARRMHINLRTHHEYLGSAAFVAPDPVIQEIDHFMLPAEVGRGERIFYRIVPLPGQTLEGLKLSTFDEQEHLLTNFETTNVPLDGVIDIDKGSCTGQYGYVITHPEHGVLLYSPPAGFIRQIGVNIRAVPSSQRKISVPIGESSDARRIEYLAGEKPELASTSVIGEPHESGGVSGRVAAAAARREMVLNAERYGQRWFPSGSREEAMRFIHSEIRKARSRVLIADPYLTALQLGQFLYAINGNVGEVTLLTSSQAFKFRKADHPRVEMLRELSRQLGELKSHQGISAKVYLIAASALHDRFLVLDNTVWFLGSSLNSLGEKASMIVKLPDPTPVIDRLIDLKGAAEDIESFLDGGAISEENPE